MTAARIRLALLALVLVAAHFAVRPRLGDARFAPDFVLVALLLITVRTRPGVGSVAGFLTGLATDAVAPTAFGAATLAFTVVGYLAGWLKAFVVEEHLVVTALFIGACAWLRDIIQVLAAQQLAGRAVAWQLLVLSPVAALVTGAVALVVLGLARGLLAVPARA